MYVYVHVLYTDCVTGGRSVLLERVSCRVTSNNDNSVQCTTQQVKRECEFTGAN